MTVVWDRHDAAIMEVDGFTLNSPLAGDVLITHHRDQPGVIGSVGTILARHDVNIAGMQVGRHLPRRGGEAIMVLNVDDVIPSEALDELKGIAGIETAFVVSLPQTSPQRPLFPVGTGARQVSLVPPNEILVAHECKERIDKDIFGHLHGVTCLGHVQQTGPVNPVRQLCCNQAKRGVAPAARVEVPTGNIPARFASDDARVGASCSPRANRSHTHTIGPMSGVPRRRSTAAPRQSSRRRPPSPPHRQFLHGASTIHRTRRSISRTSGCSASRSSNGGSIR